MAHGAVASAVSDDLEDILDSLVSLQQDLDQCLQTKQTVAPSTTTTTTTSNLDDVIDCGFPPPPSMDEMQTQQEIEDVASNDSGIQDSPGRQRTTLTIDRNCHTIADASRDISCHRERINVKSSTIHQHNLPWQPMQINTSNRDNYANKVQSSASYAATTPAYAATTPAYAATTPAYAATTSAYAATTSAYAATTSAYAAASMLRQVSTEASLGSGTPRRITATSVKFARSTEAEAAGTSTVAASASASASAASASAASASSAGIPSVSAHQETKQERKQREKRQRKDEERQRKDEERQRKDEERQRKDEERQRKDEERQRKEAEKRSKSSCLAASAAAPIPTTAGDVALSSLLSVTRPLAASSQSVKSGSVTPSFFQVSMSERIRMMDQIFNRNNLTKLAVRIHNLDKTTKMLALDERSKVGLVCSLMANKNLIARQVNHAIVEKLPDMKMERILEDHELLGDTLLSWPTDSRNLLFFEERQSKYGALTHPDIYLGNQFCREQQETEQQQLNRIVTDLFDGEGSVPQFKDLLYVRLAGSKSWKRLSCTVRCSGIYAVKKGDLVCIAALQNFHLYSTTGGWTAKGKIGAPTPYGFALKTLQTHSLQSRQIYFFSATSELAMNRWITAIRIAMIGNQYHLSYQFAHKSANSK